MLLRWFEHSQVYHPGREMDARGTEASRPFEDVFFKASDEVELNGWYFAPRTNSPRGHIAVLLCHGNGGNISDRADLYHAWQQTGVAIFSFDYRGYGRSKSRPDEEGTYLDVQAAHRWLTQKGFTNIIAYGESLGGAIATELCLREKVSGRRNRRGNVSLVASSLAGKNQIRHAQQTASGENSRAGHAQPDG